MSRYYNIDGKKLPSVTTIISDCNNNSGPLTQWAANMVVEWIKENCIRVPKDPVFDLESAENVEIKYYHVTPENLNDSRFNFRKVSQKALDVGSEVHDLIEEHLKIQHFKLQEKHGGKPIPTFSCKKVENAFNAFLEWKNKYNLKPISLEQTVHSDRWAGTLDFYGYFNDKLYVIDWKSSKAHYPEMRYQVAAYRWAKQKFSIINGTLKFSDAIQGCGVLRLDKETSMPDWKDTSKTYEQDLNVFNKMVDLFYARHARIAKKVKGG